MRYVPPHPRCQEITWGNLWKDGPFVKVCRDKSQGLSDYTLNYVYLKKRTLQLGSKAPVSWALLVAYPASILHFFLPNNNLSCWSIHLLNSSTHCHKNRCNWSHLQLYQWTLINLSQSVQGILSVVIAFHNVSGLIRLEEGTCILWLGRCSSLFPGAYGQGNLFTYLCLRAIL